VQGTNILPESVCQRASVMLTFQIGNTNKMVTPVNDWTGLRFIFRPCLKFNEIDPNPHKNGRELLKIK
jgi:hypothetical protein